MSEVLKEGRHGGDTIDGLMTRAEAAGNKATDVLDEALRVLEEGEPEVAQSLFLTASSLYLEANNCYVQASQVDHAHSRELAALAGEMFMSAVKSNQTALDIYNRANADAREIVGVVTNGFADTFQKPESDEAEVWEVVSYLGQPILPEAPDLDEVTEELPDIEPEIMSVVPAMKSSEQHIARALHDNRLAVVAFQEGKFAKSANFVETVAIHFSQAGVDELAATADNLSLRFRKVAKMLSRDNQIVKSHEEVRNFVASATLAFQDFQSKVQALSLTETPEEL